MRVVAVLLLSLLCRVCAASEDDGKLAVATRLIELARIAELYTDVYEDCVKSRAEAGEEVKNLYRENPAMFAGLSPESDKWPEVQALYYRYRADACRPLAPESIKALYIAEYARAVSLADMQAALAFATSPAGQRLQVGNLNAARAMFKASQSTTNEAAEAAGTVFFEALKALATGRGSVPKP